jgi:hypothetical protein
LTEEAADATAAAKDQTVKYAVETKDIAAVIQKLSSNVFVGHAFALIAQEYKPQFHFLVSLLKHAIHGLLSACLIVLQEAAAQYTQAALEKLNELKISFASC